MSAEGTTTRRTQEMRSAETRGKILDATVECLIELGYAATSTPEVCRRAGMSRGALLHHFPTKAELVISAVAHLAERRASEIRRNSTPTSADTVGDILELVWLAYTGPLFHAALELWVAARSDPALHEALYPVEQSMGRGIRALWNGLPEDVKGADEVTRKRFDDIVSLTLHLLRGMALQKILKDDDQRRRQLFEVWKDIATRELGSG